MLIDFPEIHFRLARLFHHLGIPVIYFVSPQLWAWKQHRIRLVRKFVNRMLVIFPFEEEFYRERGVQAEFVGHPLADLPPPAITREQFAAENGLNPAKTWVGLLPGSRLHEIENHLPEMLDAARGLPAPASAAAQISPDYEFLIALGFHARCGTTRRPFCGMVEEYGGRLTVRLVDDARAALFHARASVVASGTATVEAALIGNPFVVVYRVSRLTYAIARRLVKVPHVAMANLIAGKRVVPELIQHDFTAANIVQHLRQLLPDGPARESMKVELGVIREALHVQPERQTGPNGLGAIETVASIVLGRLKRPNPAAVQRRSLE